MSDIFATVRGACDRKDCRLSPSMFGMSNSAGSGSSWSCRTCKRKWNVWTPSKWSDEPVYDRNGKDISEPPEPQQITEIKPD